MNFVPELNRLCSAQQRFYLKKLSVLKKISFKLTGHDLNLSCHCFATRLIFTLMHFAGWMKGTHIYYVFGRAN